MVDVGSSMPTKQEPKNPIRCPICQVIMGVQGLANHMSVSHRGDTTLGPEWDYNEYVKHAVKQKDVNHPLRLEWRRLNQ